MKISEQLQNPTFQKKLELSIVAHIVTECQKAGVDPLPLHKYRNNLATYDEPGFSKIANHIRQGAVILAQELDEIEVGHDK